MPHITKKINSMLDDPEAEYVWALIYLLVASLSKQFGLHEATFFPSYPTNHWLDLDPAKKMTIA